MTPAMQHIIPTCTYDLCKKELKKYRGIIKKGKERAMKQTSTKPPWTTSNERKVRVWSSFTKTSHWLKSIQ